MNASFSILGLGLIVSVMFCSSAVAGITWCETEKSMVAESGTGSVSFRFQNNGTEAVKITAVKASCVCVNAVASATNVAPGMSCEIVAAFRGINQKTKLEKTIAVVSLTGTNRKTDVLKLHIDVQPGIVLDPPILIWAKGETPQPKSVSVKVARVDQPLPVIKKITGGDPNFTVAIDKPSDALVNGVAVTVAPVDTSKPVRSLIRIMIDNPASSERSKIMYAIVQPY